MADQKKPTIPLFHLNGSSGDALIEGYMDAHGAVNEALDKLAAASPNARDYYPLGPGVWEKAVQEHDVRMEKLREVAREVAQVVDAIDAQRAAIEDQKRGR